MQNAIPVEHNNCALSEAKSGHPTHSQTKAGDAKPSDMPSMPSVAANAALHNHNQLVNSVANTAPNSCHKNINTNTNCSSPKLNLMAELFESEEEEDDDNSEVESFTLDEEPVLDTSKFLLSAETSDTKLVSGLNLRDPPEIDAESRANLEALLDADKHLIDPDVLRRIASSFAVSDVHCALDEAAAAIAKMRINDSQLSSLSSTTTLQKSDPSQDLSTNIDASSRLNDDRCSVNEVTEEGESFLSFACSSGHYELAKQLLAARANVEDRGLKDTTPLMEACSAGHLKIVELLIDNNAEVNAQTSQGNTPLMYACAGGHEDVVRLLLKHGANVEDHNENGHTPLMEAASAGHVGVASILVDQGASINTHSNEFKESALTLACYKGHLEMVRFLLGAGADQEHKTDEMHTALMEASMDGHVEVARLLLDSGAQVNMPADSFESPLTLAACGGHVELAMLLLERGANIEEVNDEGYTPLMEAAREGHEEMVALLLSQGADINAQTEETQETALTLACCGGFLDVADFLIKAGADIEAGANTPLMEAAQEGHLDLVRHLINCGANVNATTSSGDTALMYACENGHTDVAELLLQAGADLEHEAEGGRTSLMKASRAGHLCTVQFLMNKGANVNKVTANNDHTALSLACAGGHLAVVELLLANGSDPTHRLKDSSTMLIEAAKGGHTTVVQLLIDYPNNLMASSSPLLPSHLTSSSTDTDVTPRVPPHGLQLEDTSSRTQSSISSLQSKINIQKSISKKSSSKDNASANKANVAANRPSDCVDGSFVPHSKNRVGNKVLERSLSDSGTSFIGQTNLGITESTTFSSIDALKEAERLEARINDMIRRTDELDPAKEEQIRQKQQILEELQRVEREYQAHWQQQLIQCYQAGLSCGPALSQVSANIPVDNNAANISSPAVAAGLDVPNLQKPNKSEPSFQMPSSLTQSNLFPPTSTSGSDLSSINLSVITTQNACTNTVSTATNTSLSLSTTPPNRRFRCNSKIKSMSQKHSHPPCVAKSAASHSAEEVKNSINLEHLEPNVSIQSSVSQQTQNLLQQQQMILSELAQNFSSRPETLQFLQAAASNMKIDASIPFLLPRLFEPNTLSQSSVIQSPNQNQSTSQSLTVTNETVKKSSQTTAKAAKGAKSAKVGNCLNPSQTQPSPTPTSVSTSQTSQMTQTASLLQTLTSEQLTLLKNQFTAAASTATQTDSPSNLQPMSTSSITTPTVISQTPYSSATTGGIYSMGAPAFPVSLTLTPVAITPPTTTSNNRAAIISTIIPYPVDEDNTSKAVVSDPDLSDINNFVSAAPQMSNSLITSGIDTTTGLSSILTNSFNPNINFDSSAFANVSTVLTASLAAQPVNTGFPLSPHISHTITNPIDSFAANAVLTDTAEAIDESIKAESIASSLATTTTTTPPTNLRIPSPPPWYPPIDLDSQTDSNHDTALTLACAGGHEELVSLLLNRGAEMEHRDKKGFTPLMLASTAGHSNVVEILLNNGADMEAQSERTKDTALSLACSSGRYEVVEILLSRGANKEHRNVSDYTPLSLAASGGYVNIIKLLLSHGAEINSRTGSKLGISPLMLAAMNGHTTTVRLLLDMGSDINAQIETNRNTALTLACFQGRCEVVGLLLDRKANVEHRAKTGLTPLMEAASGGYVEVGRVLVDKGADVNAPPVPSSRDTALTIAADKGHYRFVELLLSRNAAVDVKNKKGNSPLWLACNGGHLDVVQLLVNAGCDIDSQDNRKVSCLMAAFRKGHVKVVKWMVKHVNQFPSDQEITRFIALINDKELLKKTNQCAEILRQAKERQAAEANKNATILLEEIDLEQKREENRKAAAARRRERKRQKKKEKLEQIKATKNGDDKENKKGSKGKDRFADDDYDDEDDDDDDNDDSNDEDDEEVIEVPVVPPPIRDIPPPQKEVKVKATPPVKPPVEERLKEPEKPKKVVTTVVTTAKEAIQARKANQRMKDSKTKRKEEPIANEVEFSHQKSSVKASANHASVCHKSIAKNGEPDPNRPSNDIFSELAVETHKEVNGNSPLSSAANRSPSHYVSSTTKNSSSSAAANQSTPNSAKKGQKREEGWKEVVRKSKKVVVPSNAISRVIGRGGCNINTIREISGAHIEVEKQKGQGDRNVIIKGSADATRHAQQLITALSKETEKELSEIIKSLGLSRPTSVSSDEIVVARNPCKSQSTAAMGATTRQTSVSSSNVQKSSSMGSVGTSGMSSIASAFSNRSTLLVRTTTPMAHSTPFINAWTNPKTSSAKTTSASGTHSTTSTTKSTVSYTMAVAAKGKANTKTTSVSSIVSTVPKVITSEMKAPPSLMASPLRPTGAPQGVQPFNQVFTGARVPVPNSSTGVKSNSFLPSAKQPFNSLQPTATTQQSSPSVTTSSGDIEQKQTSDSPLNGSTPEYTPFNNLFSKVAQQSVWGQSKEKPNFASVAASGLTTMPSANAVHSPGLSAPLGMAGTHNATQELSIDASKAPGYRGNLHISPSNVSMTSTPPSSNGSSGLGPIGSGHARSAPCTPPLMSSQGPLTPSNSAKMSSPPLSETASSPTQHSLMHDRVVSMTEPHNQLFAMTNESNSSAMSTSDSPSHSLSSTPVVSSSPAVTSYHQMIQSNVINSSNMSPIASNTMKSQNYGIASQRHFAANASFSQNSPLGSIGAMQAMPDQGGQGQGQQMFVSANANIVQSNLNPNAPDFSARNVQSSHQMNGPSSASQNRMTMNSGPNMTPSQTIILQDQMRAAILAASANLQLQTLQKQQAARMQMAANPALLQNHLATNDFGGNTPPPSPETLRLLHTAINSIPNPSSYGMQMPSSNYMPQQFPHQRITSASNVRKEIETTGDYEERKQLPRPIGTERAQRKNPNPMYSHNLNSINETPVGMWPFGVGEVMSGDMPEWMPTATQMSNSSNIASDNPMSNMSQNRFNSSEDISQFDSSYLMNAGSHVANNMNFSGMPVVGAVNGVPPHLSSALYQSVSANSGLNVTQDDYWTAKMGRLSAASGHVTNDLSSSQSATTDHKMNWNHWNQQS